MEFEELDLLNLEEEASDGSSGEDEVPVSDPIEDEVDPGPSRLRVWAGVALRWTARAVAAALVIAMTPVVATGAVLTPYVGDDLALDRVVRAVALDWRDFGKDAAESRLDYELDREGIGLQVRDQDCLLLEDGETRIVECRWETAFSVPGVPEPVVLPFASRAEITPDGDLR